MIEKFQNLKILSIEKMMIFISIMKVIQMNNMPSDLCFVTYEKLGLIIILFQVLIQVTFGDGKDNERSIDKNGEILAYQILALIN
jgi:hypothetical protein